MKKFVWRLQRVLDVKNKEEQIRRMELLKLTGELSQLRGMLLIQKKILNDLISDAAGKKGQIRLIEQEFLLNNSTASDELIKKLGVKVIETEAKQKQKVAEVMKIRQFKEGLEKLREKARAEFIKEQEKQEQKEMEDRTTMSFANKMMNANLAVSTSS
jgi:flagellar biosynthesis chaperone FliJ